MTESIHFHRGRVCGPRRFTGVTLALVAVWSQYGISLMRGAEAENAGDNVSRLTERELARRKERMTEADTLLKEGGMLQAKADHAGALRLFRQAWDILPDAPVSTARRLNAQQGYSRSASAATRQLAGAAASAPEKVWAESNLRTDFHPENAASMELEKWLTLAQGHLALGSHESANDQFRKVLNADPYNEAARRGMTRSEELRTGYYEAAREQTRAGLLSTTAQLWEDPVPAVDVSRLFGSEGSGRGIAGDSKDSVLLKLRKLVVPLVDLDAASLEEVIEFLRSRSRELDPARKGIAFVLKAPPEVLRKPLSLRLSSVPVEEVLRHATELAGAVYRVDEHAVIITSRTEKHEALISRQYRVPGSFLQTSPVAGTSGGSSEQLRRLGAQELLQERGVPFPPGTAASYNPATSVLFVRNTAENLLLVDVLVEQAVNATVKQVEIQVRMVEVSEARLKECGFDWLLGQFNVPGSEGVFAGGGGQSRPGDGLPFEGNPVTNGLRSSEALPTGLLGRRAGPRNVAAPGMFAVSGVFTDPQFQVVLRGLNQSKGVDVLATPTLFAKSGQRAEMRMMRELRYPKEYDAAQTPTSTVGAGPARPSTPSSFDKRDVGISLEVEPVIGNNRVVDLNLSPSFVDFEGFVDYGDDFLNSSTTGPTGEPVYYRVANQILQPVFRISRISTTVSVWDGCTVVLGGVGYEKRQKLDDKVPVVGDLPLAGRLFQSKAGLVERTHLLFFVTVHMVDPAGNRMSEAVVDAGSSSDRP